MEVQCNGAVKGPKLLGDRLRSRGARRMREVRDNHTRRGRVGAENSLRGKEPAEGARAEDDLSTEVDRLEEEEEATPDLLEVAVGEMARSAI